MARNKGKKIEFQNIEQVYSFLQASKILHCDWRTLKKNAQKLGLNVDKVNNRYYVTEQQLKTLQGEICKN